MSPRKRNRRKFQRSQRPRCEGKRFLNLSLMMEQIIKLMITVMINGYTWLLWRLWYVMTTMAKNPRSLIFFHRCRQSPATRRFHGWRRSRYLQEVTRRNPFVDMEIYSLFQENILQYRETIYTYRTCMLLDIDDDDETFVWNDHEFHQGPWFYFTFPCLLLLDGINDTTDAARASVALHMPGSWGWWTVWVPANCLKHICLCQQIISFMFFHDIR